MPVDLAGVVTDCSRRNVPAGVSLHAGTLQRAVVPGNESQLSRMVSNVVDNALRHTRSKVELSVTVSRRWACISVTDDGPEYQNRTGNASGTGSCGSTTTAPRQAGEAASASPSSGKSPGRTAGKPRPATPRRAPAPNSSYGCRSTALPRDLALARGHVKPALGKNGAMAPPDRRLIAAGCLRRRQSQCPAERDPLILNARWLHLAAQHSSPVR